MKLALFAQVLLLNRCSVSIRLSFLLIHTAFIPSHCLLYLMSFLLEHMNPCPSHLPMALKNVLAQSGFHDQRSSVICQSHSIIGFSNCHSGSFHKLLPIGRCMLVIRPNERALVPNMRKADLASASKIPSLPSFQQCAHFNGNLQEMTPHI